MNPFSLDKLPTDISKEIASRFRTLRRQVKLSQAQIADISGVSLGSIKRFEQTGKISLDALLKLAHVLGRLADFDKMFEQKLDLAEVEKLFSSKTRR